MLDPTTDSVYVWRASFSVLALLRDRQAVSYIRFSKSDDSYVNDKKELLDRDITVAKDKQLEIQRNADAVIIRSSIGRS